MVRMNKEYINNPVETIELGNLHMKLDQLLKENNISKTKFCKLMDIPQQNLTKYLKNSFSRIDAVLLLKICYFFDCEISDIIEYIPPKK